MSKIKQKHLIGKIQNFPLEVVKKNVEKTKGMLWRKNIQVFQENPLSYDKGFIWEHTREGHAFWEKILVHGNFEEFFARYPRKLKYPRVMEVSRDNLTWRSRVVFMKKNDRFLAWDTAETIADSEYSMQVSAWSYAREIQNSSSCKDNLVISAKNSNLTPELKKTLQQLIQEGYDIQINKSNLNTKKTRSFCRNKPTN